VGRNRRRLLAWIGGVVATLVLLGIGITYIVIGANGRSEVHRTVAREQIVGTPDMTPQAIVAEAHKSGLKVVPDVPSCSVANVAITDGSKAKCFASYMRIHALEASGGQTYAQMGRYLDKNGKPTSDQAAAAKDPKTGQPVSNPARDLWVTETALSTGLDVSYFAEQVSLFAIVIGVCLVVIGIGLGVLTIFTLGLTPWRGGPTPPSGQASAS
jgi:hypothetical protein